MKAISLAFQMMCGLVVGFGGGFIAYLLGLAWWVGVGITLVVIVGTLIAFEREASSLR